ncbi:MAG: hypothetical protein NC828_06710, partial [Candidatus Omnitrophica bacterium]|nr:hypothetical protein [Candidatus Omnitrophota bacterium]
MSKKTIYTRASADLSLTLYFGKAGLIQPYIYELLNTKRLDKKDLPIQKRLCYVEIQAVRPAA